MAEILGVIASGITLAGLFKTCLEAFDLIQTGRSQEVDLKKLKLRLSIEKCRLYVWGESMGLTCENTERERRPIDTFRFPEIVREILENVFDLFHDSHKIQDKYGCKRLEATSNKAALLEQVEIASGPIRSLATSFSNFAVRSSQNSNTTKLVSKVVWVIHDRKKFGALVAEIKYLVDSLQGITSPCVPIVQQAGTIRRKIVEITDPETLSLIADVCSDDHPDIADAASTRADTISMVSSERRYVAAWAEHTDASQREMETGRMSPDVDSMTVTELKHLVLKVRAQQKEHEASSMSTDEPGGLHGAYTDASTAQSAPEPILNDTTDALNSTGMNLVEDTAASILAQYTPGSSLYAAPSFINPWAPWAPGVDSTGVACMPTRAQSSAVYGAYSPTAPNQNWNYNTSQPTVLSIAQIKSDQIQSSEAASQACIESPRELLSMSQGTPQNTYESQLQRSVTPDSHNPPPNLPYGPPRNSTASSYALSVHENSSHYDGSASGSIFGDHTDRSSTASEAGYNFSRSSFSMAAVPAPPQSMMGQFSTTSSTSQKKHKCKICNRRFTRPSSLQTHMYIHTGEKPFACEFEGCGRHFSVVSNLRRHRKVHKAGGSVELG
ncbi:hypothetical protein K505DRAFT_290850 [Melanomma pulvis-pyrius CBS 109.77]|uniref:C2H2-type domain-containing protein n=1 Tax=Melanomma pulvis-pyrius CBS 109.77 TaxID=1314802 RepID=A0A6A6WP95_9PLEO|nr:hypothetical protein K505DRAFT_290850 [Melanomma pulvis-pyrius CBS 109.77]